MIVKQYLSGYSGNKKRDLARMALNLRDIVLVLKNQWPRKHTENTEYSQIISVSSVDSVAIYHDFDLSAINRSDAKDAEEVSDVRTGGIPYADSRTILVWHGRALV